MEDKDLLTSGCALAGVITITLFFIAIAALLIKLIAWALFVWCILLYFIFFTNKCKTKVTKDYENCN